MALKLLDPNTDPDDVLREASLQRRLSNGPRIVPLRNVELGANPTSFVVSELVPGGSLQDILDVRRPTVRESHRWLRDTLEALSHAHRLSVLHRDIKPSNLLLGADGHALLTDFGVAEDSVVRAMQTPGMYWPTMPPEGPSASTVQTDLWLVGVLGWQLLTGARPDVSRAYAGNLELAHRLSPEVPIALSRAVALGLEVLPSDRPDSAERMLEAVGKVRIEAGFHDLPSTDPEIVRAWKGDAAAGHVIVEIRRRARGGFLVTGRAPTGSRLAARRHETEASEAAAIARARSWLEPVVRGVRL